VTVTGSAAEAEGSVDETATIAATRARAGALAGASADAWRAGDAAKARSLLDDASGVISRTLGTIDAPELRADQARAAELQSLGYTEGDSYAAKAASEASRELSR
jgi:hypothetical protein